MTALLKRIGYAGQFQPHGLRATCACMLYEAGCDHYEIMAITGHKNLSSLERYLKKAIQKRNALSAGAKVRAKSRRDALAVVS